MSGSLVDPRPPEPVTLERTPVFSVHQRLGAHFVPFAGWEMPLYYQSIRAEHDAVRTGVGEFDVSHMGILTATGVSAASLLSRRTTANIGQLRPGQCRYTFLLNFAGAILDDLLVTRLDNGGEDLPSFLVVPNAARAKKVFELLLQHRRPDTQLQRLNGQVAILAVQGPKSAQALEAVFGWHLSGLKFYEARLFPSRLEAQLPREGRLGVQLPASLSEGIWVSRTGYTGELGYELFVKSSDAASIFDRLLASGVAACGLGARDMLRLEKGYLLSGQDFNMDRTPVEAGQEKFVSFDHPFVGREPLEQQRQAGPPVRLAGLRIDQAGAIPRHGSVVLYGGRPVATVTSGGLSPSLNAGIALAYLPPLMGTPGTELQVEIRGRSVTARVVPLPFLSAGPRRL